MTNTPNPVHILNAALDESPLRGGTIVIRGVIDPRSLKHLLVDSYQREALPLSSLSGLIAAIQKGDTLPDIELGMRGKKTTGGKSEFVLRDQVFIIDGQQRVNACLAVLAKNADAKVHLGTAVHLDTDFSWERDRFRVLNSLRAGVKPSVLIRNERDRSAAVGSIYGLSTNDKTFVLHDKVCWSQSMKRGELMTGLQLMKVTARIHAHKTAGRGNNITEIIKQADKLYASIGAMSVRENVKTFFDVIDACWGIKLVHYREMAPYLRGGFLHALANVFSDHHDFWRDPDEKRLFLDVDQKKKLKGFPLTDPNIAALTSAGGKAPAMLYVLIVEHFDSGKKHRRLRARKPPPSQSGMDNEEEAA